MQELNWANSEENKQQVFFFENSIYFHRDKREKGRETTQPSFKK